MPPELFPRPAFSLTPEPGRCAPKLWVRRIVIWREPKVVLRDIRLRPGFNIIWSPDSQGPDSPIGHGGGKTTFCRLLRFCLGEDTFAPDGLRQRISELFPKGWVGTEVALDGKVWTVLRALGPRRRDIVQEGGSLDDAFAVERKPTGITPLVEALTKSVLGDSASLVPSSIGPDGAWKASLAWVTRDQECRFGHCLGWRSSDSDSLSPVVNRSAEDKLLVVRAAIGALSKHEISSQQHEERLRSKLAGHRSYVGRLEWQLGRKRRSLGASLKTSQTLTPGTPIAIAIWKKAAAEQLSKALNLPVRVTATDVARVRRNRDSAKEEFNRTQAELKQLKDQITAKQETKSFIAGELPEAHARLINEKNPVCPICKVRIDKALAEGCGISIETCDLYSLQMEIAQKRERMNEIDREVSALRANEPILRAETAKAQQAFDNLNEALQQLEQSFDISATTIRAAQKLTEDVEEYESLQAEYDRAILALRKLESGLEKARDTIASYRESSSANVVSLSNWFDVVIRELVPGDVRGSAKLDGNGLKLDLELGGNRSTAAIDSLKVIAFDLATLVMSMERSLCMPGILVHDSPREADLSQTVYERLFAFAAKLESCGSAPLFQYVLTTTTAPPEHFRREPWMRLVVKGAPAEERLLKGQPVK